jgi:hypothetical protein
MQALEGSSPGARDALLALTVDLKLSQQGIIRALEYARDKSPSYSNITEAFYYGLIMQGYRVDIWVLDMALQRLRRNFGSQCCGVFRLETRLILQGIFGVPTAQHVSLQEWSAQPSAWGGGQLSRSVVSAPTQHTSLQEWSTQPSSWSGGQPLRSAVAAPTEHAITTEPSPSQRVFNSNSNSGNGYQHTAAWSGSSLPEPWSTSQQMYSTSGTHVTTPNVTYNSAEVKYLDRSPGWNPPNPHGSHRSGH